jgi:hypothetical protein
VPLPPEEEENAYGLPPEWIPYYTPKPSSTPVVADDRATPTPAPTDAPRDSELTPTPEPSEDPGEKSTPVPAPVEPDPEPAPIPDAGEQTQGTPVPMVDLGMEAAPAAILPEEHKLVIVIENQVEQDEEGEAEEG